MLNNKLMDVIVEPERVVNPDAVFVIVAAVVVVAVAAAVAVIIRTVNKKKNQDK